MKIAIVGSGLSGATLARQLANKGYEIDMFEKRSEIGGNCSDRMKDDTLVSDHGAHIFHTNRKDIWYFVNRHATFNNYTHQVLGLYDSKVYSLPINMFTFNQLGIYSPDDARDFVEGDRVVCPIPMNFEESCLDKFGKKLYEMFIKGYSEKQWGRPCTEIPNNIVDRIPLRYDYDTRYFTDRYQGVPMDGYTNMIKSIISHDNINLFEKNIDLDWLKANKDEYVKIYYCGALDKLFGCKLGALDYRSLKFKHHVNKYYDMATAVLNNTGSESKHTRVIDWRKFQTNKDTTPHITKEFPADYDGTNEPYYPVGGEKNIKLFQNYYKELLSVSENIVPLGRLATYRYINMDEAIGLAFKESSKLNFLNL